MLYSVFYFFVELLMFPDKEFRELGAELKSFFFMNERLRQLVFLFYFRGLIFSFTIVLV